MTLPRPSLPSPVLLGQLACLAALCYGIWLIYPPAAYIVAGVVGAVILEWLDLRRNNTPEKDSD